MVVIEPESKAPLFADYPALPHPESQRGGLRAQEAADPFAASTPRVSIVTIVRNSAKTLPRTLESVISQDFRQIEYVVVDGGSTDGTLDVLRAAQNRIDLWISEPDRGISDAFNKGIAFSRGEIIGLLNSDDWYEPGAIGAVVDAMDLSGADIACGKMQYWEGNHRTYLTNSAPELLQAHMTVGHPTVFVRRKYYEEIGLYRLDFRLAMDYEWLLRAKTAGAQFVTLGRCLSNMQSGGVGDRRWRMSQREVARARAIHIPGADTSLAYHAYVSRSIFKGVIRRGLDGLGLGVIRRMYHRWLSSVTVVSNHENGKRR